jgi:hypothetical protein
MAAVVVPGKVPSGPTRRVGRMEVVRRRLLPVVALLVTLVGCSAEPTGSGSHSHAGGASISLPVGDGTEAADVGYTLTDVTLPSRAGRTGQVRFRIDSYRGTPVTDYLVEQTRKLHLYVVRDDLAVFRHLHPTMAEDGTWSAPVSLPASGSYRVIAEFVARDEGGNGDHLILGRDVEVPAGPTGGAPPVDPVVDVTVSQPPTTGADGRLRLLVRDAVERPVRLGTYLGAYGHVTGFHRTTGSLVHLHPLAAPEVTEAGSELSFHTEIEQPGEYRLFVQVRVDGYLHSVPVDVRVAEAA